VYFFASWLGFGVVLGRKLRKFTLKYAYFLVIWMPVGSKSWGDQVTWLVPKCEKLGRLVALVPVVVETM